MPAPPRPTIIPTVSDERFEEHLRRPQGLGLTPTGGHAAAAGGSACGDLVQITLGVDGDRVGEVGFDAEGCGATFAAASAAVSLIRGATILDAARIGARQIAAELGGLSPGKLHAADLAADALARALGSAAFADAQAAPVPGRTLVAMSGGVDSAVAALLAAQAGDALAVTLELWRHADNDAERSCCSASAVLSARSLAHGMGLPHLTLDLRDAFRAGVVEPWLAGHAAGVTPNPCVRCNGEVRLDAMLALAAKVGAERLATGHYARIGPDGLLCAAGDPAKDQTYMLAGLALDSLRRLWFPLGDMTKPQVRDLAEAHGLPVARRPDSQDLCFLAGTGRAAFLERHLRVAARPGPVLDLDGREIGRHEGAHGYTVGQRRGVGVGGKDAPLHVIATDVERNTVTVAPRAALERRHVRVGDVRLHAPENDVDAVKLRYRSQALACTLRGGEIELHEPAWAAAPGQTAVFLAGDRVLGTATIEA